MELDNVETEETVPFAEPADFRPLLDEKPLFHSSQMPPVASVPFELSCNGDCVPHTINRYLRDYQREGVKFIYESYACGSGCVLGDDMGLGKTIQVIAFLAAVLHKKGTWEDVEKNVPDFLLSQKSSKERKSAKAFLIVAPLSVLYNWKDELDTWGHFRIVVVHGARKDEEFARVRRGRCEIALTTYETLRLCLDQFNSIEWSAVIVDEAHKIKNPSSQITQAMKAMKCRVRVGLTGTVLQNNLEELWCVMDWAIPGCLGTLDHFKTRFADPIEQGQKHSATKRSLATGRVAVRGLARKLSRWFLRRTKALISAQLPRKDDRVVFCSLTDFQLAVYRAVLDSEDVTLLLRSGEHCGCGSRRPRRKCCFKVNSKGVRVRDLYFSYLTILRKVANHVALLQPNEATSKKQEQYVNDVCEKVFQKFPDFIQRCKQAAFEAMSDPMYSGKMKVLQRLLNYNVSNRDKVLLFSLSTKLLDVLESYCKAEGFEYRRLDGTTKSRDRVRIAKEFNSSEDINVCLVSTMAGGLGLNFVGANIVVLFDPTWNPANDLQAIDRAYRIGQCRDVTVLRLISLGTVEEVIYLRQVYKQQLESAVVGKESARRYFEAVQGPEGHAGELFGTRNLFRLQTEGTCLTKQILQREGRLEAGVISASAQTGEGRTRESMLDLGSRNAEWDSGRAEKRAAAGVLDFSSSEDEGGHSTWKRPLVPGAEEVPGPGPSGSLSRLSLLHHRFSRRLQGSQAGGEQSSDSEEGPGDSLGEAARDVVEKGSASVAGRPAEAPQTTGSRDPRHVWTTSSDSEGEIVESNRGGRWGAVSSRMESDVVDGGFQGLGAACPKRRTRRRRAPKDSTSEGSGESGDIVFLKRVRATADANRGNKHNRRVELAVRNGRESRGASSEEDVPVKKMTFQNGDPSAAGNQPSTRQAEFTRLRNRGFKRPTALQNDQTGEDLNAGAIDKLLGGVQEVVYLHSNQHIVGSSRAEDRISRAALRDVFQRGMNSQAPANLLLDSAETLSEDTEQKVRAPVSEGTITETGPGHQGPPVEPLVRQSPRAVQRTQNATVILGGTPSAIRRSQLEEMALFFGASSVKAFAEDVLSCSSDSRRAKLKEFYSSQNPQLKDVICAMLDSDREPVMPHPRSSSATTGLQPLASLPTVAGGRASRSASRLQVQGTGNVDPRSSRKVKGSGFRSRNPETSEGFDHHEDITLQPDSTARSSAKSHTAGNAPGLETAANSGSPDHHTSTPAKRESCREQTAPKPFSGTEPLKARDSPRTPSHLLTDLIGDTSILDDLFKTRAKVTQPVDPPAFPAPSRVAERAKSRGKDFWDILNEGNEESINELADLSRVEEICRNANVAAKAKNAEKGLWRKNENFLWKK